MLVTIFQGTSWQSSVCVLPGSHRQWPDCGCNRKLLPLFRQQTPSHGSLEWVPGTKKRQKFSKEQSHKKVKSFLLSILEFTVKLCCYLAVWPEVPLYERTFFLIHQYAIVVMIGHFTQWQCLRWDGQQTAFHGRHLHPNKATPHDIRI